MSADNGIHVLVTTDRYKRPDDDGKRTEYAGENGVTAYRVAYRAAMDYDYYLTEELHNLGHYMNTVWGASRVYYDVRDAMEEAERLDRSWSNTEYGVRFVHAEGFNFPDH